MTCRRTPSAPSVFTTHDTRRRSVVFQNALAPHRRKSAISPGRAPGSHHQRDRPVGRGPRRRTLLAVLSAIGKDARLSCRRRGADALPGAQSPRRKPPIPTPCVRRPVRPHRSTRTPYGCETDTSPSWYCVDRSRRPVASSNHSRRPDRSSGKAAVRRPPLLMRSRPHASPCSPASQRFSDFQAR